MNSGGPSRGSDLLDGSFISDICKRKNAIKNVHKKRRQKEFRGKRSSHPEGQEVSGEHRFGMFAECGGKGKDEGKHLHTPKGARFQENIDLVCSFLSNIFLQERAKRSSYHSSHQEGECIFKYIVGLFKF
jgi:hypothetical protein